MERIQYDVFGQLIAENVNGTTTEYAVDGWNPAKAGATGTSNFDVWATFTSGGSLITRQLQGDGIDQHLAYVTSSNAYWYLTDHLGSTRATINNSGTVQDSLVYDAYGNLISQSNASAEPLYTYTGREVDVETGLQYNRARWYDPSTGRWISQDPLGFDAGDSNLYRYVNNRPTVATDPSGRQWQVVDKRIRTSGEVEKLDKSDVAMGQGTPYATAWEAGYNFIVSQDRKPNKDTKTFGVPWVSDQGDKRMINLPIMFEWDLVNTGNKALDTPLGIGTEAWTERIGDGDAKPAKGEPPPRFEYSPAKNNLARFFQTKMQSGGRVVWRFMLMDGPGCEWTVPNAIDYTFRVKFTSYELRDIANSKITGEYSLLFHRARENRDPEETCTITQGDKTIFSATVTGAIGAFPRPK